MKKIKLLIVTLVVSCCLLGVGYASISDIDLGITGDATLDRQTGIVISNVTLESSNHADTNASNVNTYYQTMLDTTVVLENASDAYLTYLVEIKNMTNKNQVYKGIVYDQQFYDNLDIDYEITGLNINDVVPAGSTTTAHLKFKYKNTQASYNNTTLNSIISFDFDEETSSVIEKNYNGACQFNGRGNDIVGDCAEGRHLDYLDTGIPLFSDDLYQKDFEIGFTVDSIDPSRFRAGKVDTIFDCIKDSSPYPGITFRIQDSKWYLQAGTGVNNAKISFNADAIQTFKLYRISGKIYYSINGGEKVYFTDLTGFNNTFNQSLLFGAAMQNSGVPYSTRYLVATISNMYVKVTEPDGGDEHDDAYYDQLIEDFIGEPLTVAYNEENPHTFDGTTDTTTHTNISLFDSNNWDKSWVVTLNIDSLNFSDQLFAQATIFNAKNESDSPYVGVVFRRNAANDTVYKITIRSDTNVSSVVSIPATAKRVNIIKKGMSFYYQFDYSDIQPMGENNTFSTFTAANAFNTEATFGAITYNSGNYDRMIVGTLSNMRIKIASSS